MCKCNTKYSKDLDHVRILAMLQANISGEDQAIYSAVNGYNFIVFRASQGKNVIEIITPDKSS